MEIVLLLIAGGVAYYLYHTLQEYLKNPLHQRSQTSFPPTQGEQSIDFKNPYESMRETDRVEASEFSVLAGILGYVVWSDKQMSMLEEQLVDEILADMAAESKNPKHTQEELKEILCEMQTPNISLDRLCERYVEFTKGEYKKRVKVVEFLFAVAYADGSFQESERECIIEIAALFELSNEDFNTIFDSFAMQYDSQGVMEETEARKIFEFPDTFTKEELQSRYHRLLKEAKQNIFDSKNINKSFTELSMPRLKAIDEAYRVLLPLVSEISEEKAN